MSSETAEYPPFHPQGSALDRPLPDCYKSLQTDIVFHLLFLLLHFFRFFKKKSSSRFQLFNFFKIMNLI